MDLKRLSYSLFSGRLPRWSRGLRCALVEFNYYHGETLPTLVRILNELEVKVEVFCPERLRHNNPFVYTHDLQYELRDSDHLLNGRLARHFRRFDFVIVNSLEPKENLTAVQNIALPLIGVMHNAGLIFADSDFTKFFNSPRRKALVMAKHISDFVSDRIEASWISPVELGSIVHETPVGTRPTTFCVQGNLEHERRNYQSLINAVEHLNSQGIRNFVIKMIGRSDTRAGAELRRDIRAKNVDTFFEFSQGELPYRDYYGSIAHTDFLLPLVDWKAADHAAYFKEKLSTSMQIAIAFQVIPIVHTDLATSYGVEDDCFTYSDNLEEAMSKALNSGVEDRRRMQIGLRQRRANLLEASTSNIKSLLRELGLANAKVSA